MSKSTAESSASSVVQSTTPSPTELEAVKLKVHPPVSLVSNYEMCRVMSAAARSVRKLRLVHKDNNDRAIDKLLTKEPEANKVEVREVEVDRLKNDMVKMSTGR